MVDGVINGGRNAHHSSLAVFHHEVFRQMQRVVQGVGSTDKYKAIQVQLQARIKSLLAFLLRSKLVG